MSKQTFMEIPLKEIVLSGDNKRNIDEKSESFLELKASIDGGGVRVPIQVRMVDGKKGKYELRAGERRFRACKALGLETIPALVTNDMADEDAVDLTCIENKFREDLKPMEEAAEVAMWMERVGGNAKVIAERLGKSEQWVRVRANIIGGLCKQWLDIFKNLAKHPQFQPWTTSHMLQIARLPKHLQEELHKSMTLSWVKPQTITAADLSEKISNVMHLLSKSKWDLDDETLIPKAGPCSKCPKRTAHQPMLWFDSEEQAKAGDQCLDPLCWQSKRIGWVARQAKELKNKHPKLVLVAKEHADDSEAKAVREQVGSFLPHWEFSISSKNAKGTVPAMYVTGKSAGQLTYVKIHSQPSGVSSRPKGVPTPLKQRQAQLDAKRWAQVLLDLRDKVESTTVEDLTWKDKIGCLMAAVAIFQNHKLPMSGMEGHKTLQEILKDKDNNKRQARALDMLWQSFQPTLDDELTYNGPVTQTPKELIREAEWIAELIGADLKAMFKDVSGRKGFTVPNSWASLNADGTPKKAKPKPQKAAKAKKPVTKGEAKQGNAA